MNLSTPVYIFFCKIVAGTAHASFVRPLWTFWVLSLDDVALWSNIRPVRSSRHNFANFHLNRKTYRRFWKRWVMCSNWSDCHPQVFSARNSVRDNLCIVSIRTRSCVDVWTDSKVKALKNREWRWFLRLTAVSDARADLSLSVYWLSHSDIILLN